MTIVVGADSLCWHARLESGELSLRGMLEEAVGAGAACVQLNLHHTRALDAEGLARLADDAAALGLRLLASGDFLGAARNGDDPTVGVARVERWLELATALRSPNLRVVSGFYRAELAGRPELIEVELDYVTEVLRACSERAAAAGVALLLENHSDFTVAEYRRIIEAVGSSAVGVFLDLINAVSALEDPVAVTEALAPYALAAHAKDYELESIATEDGYHRRGFSVLWRYPGEGVAPQAALVRALVAGTGDRHLHLTVEGLDNRLGVADQPERLRRSVALLRRLVDEAGDEAAPATAPPQEGTAR